jgi:hypothetical protein
MSKNRLRLRIEGMLVGLAVVGGLTGCTFDIIPGYDAAYVEDVGYANDVYIEDPYVDEVYVEEPQYYGDEVYVDTGYAGDEYSGDESYVETPSDSGYADTSDGDYEEQTYYADGNPGYADCVDLNGDGYCDY